MKRRRNTNKTKLSNTVYPGRNGVDPVNGNLMFWLRTMQAWYTPKPKSPPLLKANLQTSICWQFLQSFVADSSSFSFNTMDKNSWLCRPCSRSLDQLQAARERVENLEIDIRKKLEAVNDECQGSSVSATSTANCPVTVAPTFTTPDRLPAAGGPLFEQRSDRGTTGEVETARRRYDMPTWGVH